MKNIMIILAMFGFQYSCSQSTKQILNIEENINVKEYFWKGGIGIIGKKLYIKRSDENYVLYSKRGYGGDVIFDASPRTREIIILRVHVNGDKIHIERVKCIDRESKDFFVIFSKTSVYFLDFSSKRFGKYIRRGYIN